MIILLLVLVLSGFSTYIFVSRFDFGNGAKYDSSKYFLLIQAGKDGQGGCKAKGGSGNFKTS